MVIKIKGEYNIFFKAIVVFNVIFYFDYVLNFKTAFYFTTLKGNHSRIILEKKSFKKTIISEIVFLRNFWSRKTLPSF